MHDVEQTCKAWEIAAPEHLLWVKHSPYYISESYTPSSTTNDVSSSTAAPALFSITPCSAAHPQQVIQPSEMSNRFIGQSQGY